MPRRLFLALVLLVAAPMVLLGWVSANAVKANQLAAKEALASLLETQLIDADRLIVQTFEAYAEELDVEISGAMATSEPIIETLRRLRRESPIVRQGILVDKDGIVRFPDTPDTVGADAIEIAAALPGLIDARPLTGGSSDVPIVKGKGAAREIAPANAWQQWYLANGSQVVYWRLPGDGSSIGVILERSRWIADLISTLPDARTAKDPSAARERTPVLSRALTPIGTIALLDEANRRVYHWGNSDELELTPLVSRPVSAPLASWRLTLHVDQSLIPNSSHLPIYISLGGIGLLVLLTGVYVLTSVTRQINDARNRVSFAGQVSHELRTPLTNIRLYTELAESDLQQVDQSDAAQSVARRLEVIDHESRRLQRLVSGVLEMIRPQGKGIRLRKQSTDLRSLVDGIAEQFEPSFRSSGLSIDTDCPIDEPIEIDPDIVEMVLVNLLSNVEKYVPDGGRCEVRCEVVQGPGGEPILRMVVADDGPGIAPIHRGKIFRPFERIDDSISAPSGTGIGLTIARKAARRHGGDLVLLTDSPQGRTDSPQGGAAFELTLPLGELPTDRHAS